MAEHQPADRPGDEAERIGGERQHGAGQRVGLGEEQLVEHQRRGGAVEEEVVPLDGGADQAGDDHPAQVPPRGGGALGGG